MVKQQRRDLEEGGMDIETFERIMTLSQRTDKLEFTTSDIQDSIKNLKNIEIKECKAYCEKKFGEESQKSNDWIKILITIIILSILISGALWYSMSSRIASVEGLIIKESDVINKFVTKDQEMRSNNESVKQHEDRFHSIKSSDNTKINEPK